MQETELLVAGIPCIDVSSAGHRKGAAGSVRLISLNLLQSWTASADAKLSSKDASLWHSQQAVNSNHHIRSSGLDWHCVCRAQAAGGMSSGCCGLQPATTIPSLGFCWRTCKPCSPAYLCACSACHAQMCWRPRL